jgi:hypothetical protein
MMWGGMLLTYQNDVRRRGYIILYRTSTNTGTSTSMFTRTTVVIVI